MTPPGGPAAVYGFLYQILRTAEWALQIDLRAPRRNANNVTLIAEPRGSDLEIRSRKTRRVLQFKTREGRPWSLTDIVKNVLPGLYGAIDDEKADVHYEFVTNGSMGRWAEAREFFGALADRADALDATIKRFELGQKRHTERSLIDAIVHSLRQSKKVKKEARATTHRKVIHLLSRFEFTSTGDAYQAETNIRNLLAAYVMDDTRLDDKIGRLVKTVLGYAAKGNHAFRPDQLLLDAGIEGIAFTKLPLVRESVRRLTLADMRHVARYEPSLSVRPPYRWKPGHRLLAFSGESGQGKSWALADLAYDLMEHDREMLVVFTKSVGHLQTDLSQAVQRVSRDALGHLEPVTIEQLALKLRGLIPRLPDPWLTICLDDVSDASEIEAIADARLEEWGIRIAFNAFPRLTGHAALKRRGAIVVAVRDFSEDQLHEFLRRHEREWSAIPPDVRRTMHRPLLAELFVRQSNTWTVKVEYELYDAWWRRLSTERRQPEHPGDVAAMLALASDFRRGGEYPWSQSKLRGLGITSDEQLRLEAVGWLRPEPAGGARIWHDRLLNWAVAEAIAEEIPSVSDDEEKLAAVLRPYLADRAANTDRPHLSYVPMDVFWMAATRGILSPETLARVIRGLEENHYQRMKSLYGMLGSIGPAIMPALICRLVLSEHKEEQYSIETLVPRAALRALASSSDNVASDISMLLRHDSAAVREIGVRAGVQHPAGAHAPILWKLLVEHDAATEEAKDSRSHWRRERLFRALTLSAGQARDWLEQQIRGIEEDDRHAASLAWLLATLGDDDGRDLWLKIKSILFAKTPAYKPGGLIHCIQAFRDGFEVERLKAWLTSDANFAAQRALAALSVVAPDEALSFAKNSANAIREHVSSWWIPWLMLVRRDETLAVTKERMQGDARAAAWLEDMEHEVDSATAHALVGKLRAELTVFMQQDADQRRVSFAPIVDLLHKAAHVDVIDALATYAGSNAEQQIVAALERLPVVECDWLSDEAFDLRVILRRMSEEASSGATATANLRDGDPPLRQIRWAAAYPTPQVRDALHEFLKRSVATWDDRDHIPEHVTEAVRSLALIGDDEAVVDAVWTFGANVIDDDLAWLINDREPMDESLVERLLTALESDDPEKKVRAIGALNVSRRPDLVPLILEKACAADATDVMHWHGLRAARDLIRPGTELGPQIAALVRGEHAKVRHVLAELLFRSATSASRDLAYELAKKLPFDHVQDDHIVAKLVDQSERGREMAELLRPHLLPFPYQDLFHGRASLWVRIFPVLDSAELRQKAFDATLRPGFDQRLVIECIATFEPEAAFDLAASALRSDVKGREILPGYLLKFNGARVLNVVAPLLADEQVGVVRWAIGRVLRWAEDEAIPRRIREMSSDAKPAVRQAAYDCAGWRLDGFEDRELK
ncbi:MAG TPA: hypothetical protein VKB93_23200, partial [Thermoanaerobaculia bacterium]|nr:hypothetical protein [Thermoanaerobaculia bacterium]